MLEEQGMRRVNLGSLGEWEVFLHMAEGWKEVAFKVHFHPKPLWGSVTLW